MTEDQLSSFIERLKSDDVLHENLSRARDAESYAAVAGEAGFPVSTDWLEMQRTRLSDAELEGAGLRLTTTYPTQVCVASCGITWDGCK